MGGARRDSPVRARGFSSIHARMDPGNVLPLVGRLYQRTVPASLVGRAGKARLCLYFMVRIRIPNGLLEAHQLRNDCRRYGSLRSWRGRSYRATRMSSFTG